MQRIQTLSGVQNGEPCVAGTEIKVSTVVGLLERGCSEQQIRLGYFPDLTPADIRAVVEYAKYEPRNRPSTRPNTRLSTRHSNFSRLKLPAFAFGKSSASVLRVPLILTGIVLCLCALNFRIPTRKAAAAAKSLASLPAKESFSKPFIRVADAAYAAGQLGDAESWYLKAQDADPADAAVCLDLGVVYYREKRYGEAETQYRHAAALDPGDPTAHYDLGILLSGRLRLAEAEVEYRRAIALKPEDADILNSLGKVYCEQQRFSDAVRQFQHALHIEPEHKLARQNLRYAQSMLIGEADHSITLR